jgi:hypothetical protein
MAFYRDISKNTRGSAMSDPTVEAQAASAATPKEIRLLSPAARDKLMREHEMKAKDDFQKKYQGATLKLPVVLHHRPVVRSFTRSFNTSMRNWYIATTVARSALGDGAIAAQIEQAMILKVRDTTTRIKTQSEQLIVLAKDADADPGLLAHGFEHKETVTVLGPVAMQLRELYLAADKYLDMVTLAYTYSLMSGDDAATAAFQVKRSLESVGTSIRNRRIDVLKQVNQAGKQRQGYKQTPQEAEPHLEPAASTQPPAAAVEPVKATEAVALAA